MAVHQAQVPRVVADYFGISTSPPFEDHPVIVQVFKPGPGWLSQRHYRKRVSGAWVRKLRARGVTHVALEHGRREADFSAAELVRR